MVDIDGSSVYKQFLVRLEKFIEMGKKITSFLVRGKLILFLSSRDRSV